MLAVNREAKSRSPQVLVVGAWVLAIYLSTLGILTAAPLAVPVAEKPFLAELSAIDADGQFSFLTDQKSRQVAAADLVCWGQCVEQSLGSVVVLADGSVLMAEVVAADKDRLTVESTIAGTLKLPLESLAGIVFRPPSGHADRDRLFDRLSRAVGDADQVLLENGDEISGQLVTIVDETAKLETDAGPVDVKTDRIGSILFNPSLRRKVTSTPERREMWAGLSDGSRLLASPLTVDGEGARITAAGQSLTVSPRDLVFVQPLGGRAVYLSDLQPTNYHQTPYLDLPWPYRADRSVTAGLLRAGDRPYLKGLGVHSAARLEYDLALFTKAKGPRAKDAHPIQFQAELAVDDSTNRRGSVLFRVLVDGREKFVSPVVRGGDSPLPVSVDVTGAKKLELVVDYADRIDVLDHADLLNARIAK